MRGTMKGRACVILTMVFVSSCATTTNTPQQDYIYELARGCTNIPNAQLKRVDPDGRYWIAAEPRQEYQFQQCMDAQAKALPYPEWIKKREAGR